MRTDTIRNEVQRLIAQTPFRPFVMTMENGSRIPVEHPENIAFQPPSNGSPGSDDFYVLTNELRRFATFDAVTTVALLDQGE